VPSSLTLLPATARMARMGNILLDPERARAILEEENIDVLIASRPENFSYISGICRLLEHRHVREHTTFALLNREGHVVLVIPWFELDTAKEETAVTDIAPFRQFANVLTAERAALHRGDFPEAVAAERIARMGYQSGRIGFDELYTPVSVYEHLRQQLPGAEFVPATRVFERLRQVKTREEIARLSQAANIVEQGFRALGARLSEGVTEQQLADAALEVFHREGAPLSFLHCGAGVRSSIEHLPPSNYAVRAGDLVRFDMGVIVRGYHADVGRTFVCGQPTPRQKEIYARVAHSHHEVTAAMKPGVTGAELYDIYRREMGEYFSVFPLDWIGHSYGLELHESPFLAPTMNDPLEAGMLLAVEIVLDYPDREGYHLEEPILITENGNQRLTGLPTDSLVPGESPP